MISMAEDILILARDAAAKRMVFTPHALSQMSRPERMITTDEVLQVINGGKVIEDYPEDARGHSCLILGYDEEHRGVHVVCAPKPDFLAIITAYLPDPEQWSPDFSRRL